ncbi:unnamed protein product [Ostreobium quekettii]|uniref:Uncharacterized protein n=1 Tax=Ostreobium quekettii TaxID=121088 RepID=A0A8S1J7T4_9CHLO|nr:unnamed protein product [Ostreobium quekettii]
MSSPWQTNHFMLHAITQSHAAVFYSYPMPDAAGEETRDGSPASARSPAFSIISLPPLLARTEKLQPHVHACTPLLQPRNADEPWQRHDGPRWRASHHSPSSKASNTLISCLGVP